MIQIPDDPIIACIMRTGYPPWIDPNYINSSAFDQIEDDYDQIEEDSDEPESDDD